MRALALLTVGWLAACSGSAGDAQKPGMNAEARLRVTEAAEAAGDRDLAIAMYGQAAIDVPSDLIVQRRSAEGLARNGRLEEAAALLQHRLSEGGRRPELLVTLGSIQVLAGKPAQAQATFSEVLAMRPDDLRALVNKGVALDLDRRHGEAQALYRRALELSPRDPVISNDLALSLMLSGHVEEAQRTLLPYRDDVTLPSRIRINLGIVEAAGGNPAEAERLLAGTVSAADLSLLTRAIEAGRATP